MRIWTSIILLLAVMVSANVQGGETRLSQLQQGLEAYEQGLATQEPDQRLHFFHRAEQLFREITQGGIDVEAVRNGALYFNLGNAALQGERYGPAIVAYRRALELDPSHRQARQNLEFVRNLLPESQRFAAEEGLVESLFFWRGWFSMAQLRASAAVCFLIGALMLSHGIAWGQSYWRTLSLVPGVVWGLLLLAASVPSVDAAAKWNGVVVEDDLILHSADSENSAIRGSEPLVSGVELKILSQRDRWTEVELRNGYSGWVRAQGVEAIDL